MELECYFESALLIAQLLHKLDDASDEEKEAIQQQILHSQYLNHLRMMQSMWQMDFSQASFPKQQLNSMRYDYLINPAVPSMNPLAKENMVMSSGYHCHDYYEIVIVLKGSYVQFVRGVCYTHQAGDICILPPNIVHREQALQYHERTLFIGISKSFFQTECTRILKTIPSLYRFLTSTASQSGVQFCVLHLDDKKNLIELLDFILKENQQKKVGHHFIIKGSLLRLLSILIEESSFSYIKQSDEEQQQYLSSEILQYMDAHLNHISRPALAKFFHFNEDYLNRFLKCSTGKNYSDHLKELRMKRAANLLQQGETIGSVMQHLGLSNKGHFNQMFQATFGVLPGQYKQKKE